jgi:hypothetical protein
VKRIRRIVLLAVGVLDVRKNRLALIAPMKMIPLMHQRFNARRVDALLLSRSASQRSGLRQRGIGPPYSLPSAYPSARQARLGHALG